MPRQEARGRASAIVDVYSVSNASWSDRRLADLDIGRWTTVQVSNHDAAQLLSHYLETDHPILGLFDADLFLDGITQEYSSFCSSFLVNCVLFWACVRGALLIDDAIIREKLMNPRSFHAVPPARLRSR